jgi:nucleoside-diphosphate-sugar epimerase
MKVLITGANGFVGKGLVLRLLQQSTILQQPIESLLLLDQSFDDKDVHAAHKGPTVQYLQGNLADRQWLEQSIAGQTLSVIFHLASIPGGTAEQQYTLANSVNLDATRSLLELGQAQTERGGPPPVFVFASSIAVFGNLSDFKHDGRIVSDATPVQPEITYGAHKRIGEILIDDFSRRGWVNGRALRLPGVLARPAAKTGQMSAFLSDIIRELAAGKSFVCPMSKAATTWASSRPNIIDNLLYAAELDDKHLEANRTYTLPTHCFTMGELVDAIGQVFDVDTNQLVTYRPNPQTERLFGEYPRLDTRRAEHVGFRADSNLCELAEKAIAEEKDI